MTKHLGSETRSIQDFLKAVFLLDGLQQPVATGSLATALSIAAPSVTAMAERLKAQGLLNYRKYYGMRLTPAGARIAQNVVRRHELIEQYLIITLGYSLAEAHHEADRMEHAVSDHFVDALEKKLSEPRE